MSVKFLHLFPRQLGLNGEKGNLDCLVQRLSWAGISSELLVFDGSGPIPSSVDAVFIGSGTLSGATEALELLKSSTVQLRSLASSGTPFLALGLGWEILGQSVQALDGTVIEGAGVFPSRSMRTNQRASTECFGLDYTGQLTTGYANHSAEMELLNGAQPLVTLSEGFGNSSITNAKGRPDEGLISGNLMAARLNGPLLPLNPHLADQFLNLVAAKAGISYRQESKEAVVADGFAAKARAELKARLAR